jgi:polar amino acid transport system substrate-binding protein
MIGAVCAAAEMECVITPVAWDGIIPSLTSGQIDAIMASMSITADRMQTIDFSNKYYNTPTVIVAAKGAGIAPTTEGLAGKILGVQVSTVHQDYAQTHFPGAQIKLYQTQDEANQDLVAGRIDATQADSIALDAFLTSDAGACCEAMGAVADDKDILGLGVGVGMRKGDDELKAKFNAGIAKIIADGTYEKVSAPYFASSIYGG